MNATELRKRDGGEMDLIYGIWTRRTREKYGWPSLLSFTEELGRKEETDRWRFYGRWWEKAWREEDEVAWTQWSPSKPYYKQDNEEQGLRPLRKFSFFTKVTECFSMDILIKYRLILGTFLSKATFNVPISHGSYIVGPGKSLTS